jgi:hypothetical protein
LDKTSGSTQGGNPRHHQFSGGPAMNLNPAMVLNPVFNFLDALISDYGVYCYLVFVWLSMGAIAWVLGGGLRRKRSQSNSIMITSGIIITTRPANQLPPPMIIAKIDPVQNDGNEMKDEA